MLSTYFAQSFLDESAETQFLYLNSWHGHIIKKKTCRKRWFYKVLIWWKWIQTLHLSFVFKKNLNPLLFSFHLIFSHCFIVVYQKSPNKVDHLIYFTFKPQIHVLQEKKKTKQSSILVNVRHLPIPTYVYVNNVLFQGCFSGCSRNNISDLKIGVLFPASVLCLCEL